MKIKGVPLVMGKIRAMTLKLKPYWSDFIDLLPRRAQYYREIWCQSKVRKE